MSQSVSYGLLMLVAGIGIPVMATLNARLGMAYGNVAMAASILFCVALVCSVATLFVMGLPESKAPSLPFYYYLGGVLVAFYVLTITYVAPTFGVANAVFFVLLGQIIASVLIDHFGMFGMAQNSLSFQRVLGVIFMIVGIILARKTI